MGLKIISWNVNGMRSVMKKGFEEFVKAEKPDIICVQETKSPKGGMNLHLDSYEEYWNNAGRPGYSGTAVFTRIKPKKVVNDMGMKKHDGEGRVIACEFDSFYLVNVYVPNSKRGLERLPYRCQEWDPDFLKYLKNLEKKKPVVFCGDLNVAHTEIDLANPKGNVKNHGFTPEERMGFDNIIKADFVDTFRHFCKEPKHYTWWSVMGNCRGRNIGWRIDYFCASKKFMPKITSSTILPHVTGSDHCPVALELSVKS